MAKLKNNLSLPDETEFIARNSLNRRRVGLGPCDLGPELLDLSGRLGDLPVNSVSLGLQVMQS